MTASTLSRLSRAAAAPRRWLALLLVLGAALTVAGCGSGPQGWLDDNLTKASGSDPETGVYYSTDKPAPQAVQQISSGTSPDGSITSGGSTFLRYGSDYMVVIPAAAAAAAGGAALAELWTFDAGYARYSAQVAAWDEFRGGGSGEGK